MKLGSFTFLGDLKSGMLLIWWLVENYFQASWLYQLYRDIQGTRTELIPLYFKCDNSVSQKTPCKPSIAEMDCRRFGGNGDSIEVDSCMFPLLIIYGHVHGLSKRPTCIHRTDWDYCRPKECIKNKLRPSCYHLLSSVLLG